MKSSVKKKLPHNLDFFPVLELVRGGVGEGVFAADKGAVDSVGLNWGDRGAVLCLRPNSLNVAGIAGA